MNASCCCPQCLATDNGNNTYSVGFCGELTHIGLCFLYHAVWIAITPPSAVLTPQKFRAAVIHCPLFFPSLSPFGFLPCYYITIILGQFQGKVKKSICLVHFST